jgi:outer membrane protein OmpA-like peptidoglycan-associated protein
MGCAHAQHPNSVAHTAAPPPRARPVAVASHVAPTNPAADTAQAPATPPPQQARVDAPITHAFAPVAATEEAPPPCGVAQVEFETGSATLTRAARQQLDTYAQCVNEGGPRAVYVYGSTRPEGVRASAENTALAGTRARVIADYLHHDGVTGEYEIRAQGGDRGLEAGARPARQGNTSVVRIVPTGR